jgi:hypothetical protein
VTQNLIDVSYDVISYPDTLELPVPGEEIALQGNNVIDIIAGTTNNNIVFELADKSRPMRTNLTLSGIVP